MALRRAPDRLPRATDPKRADGQNIVQPTVKIGPAPEEPDEARRDFGSGSGRARIGVGLSGADSGRSPGRGRSRGRNASYGFEVRHFTVTGFARVT